MRRVLGFLLVWISLVSGFGSFVTLVGLSHPISPDHANMAVNLVSLLASVATAYFGCWLMFAEMGNFPHWKRADPYVAGSPRHTPPNPLNPPLPPELGSMLDEFENHAWNHRGEDPPPADSRFAVPEVIACLLPFCGNDPETLLSLMRLWAEEKIDDLQELGLVERADHVRVFFLRLGPNGIGNLFGSIPSDAVAFDPALAAEGTRRGWRDERRVGT